METRAASCCECFRWLALDQEQGELVERERDVDVAGASFPVRIASARRLVALGLLHLPLARTSASLRM